MNKYQVVRELGSGAFSVVYLARNTETGELAAVKRSQARSSTVFEQEAILMQKCKSQFVVCYFDLFAEQQHACLAMEYAAAGSLDQLVQRKRQVGTKFEESDIWRIFAQLVLGLSYIHDQGVCHKDIKAENVFLQCEQMDLQPQCKDELERLTCKIGDFGVSFDLTQKQTRVAVQKPGTPAYMSPELLENTPFTQKTDVWSMGVLIYYLCQFELPFKAVDDVINRKAPDFTHFEYSQQLKAAISEMLTYEQRQRPFIDFFKKKPQVQQSAKTFLTLQQWRQQFQAPKSIDFQKIFDFSSSSRGSSALQTPKLSEREQMQVIKKSFTEGALKRIPGRNLDFSVRMAIRANEQLLQFVLNQGNTVFSLKDGQDSILVSPLQANRHSARNYNALQYFFCQDDLCISQEGLCKVVAFVFDQAKVYFHESDITDCYIYGPKCVFVSVTGNKLRRFDLADCTSLKQLDVSRNRLSSLDISQLQLLEVLNAEENELKALDFSHNCNLKILYLKRNNIKRVLTNTAVQRADLSFNQLESAAFSAAVKLQVLNVSNNQLRRLDVVKSVRSLLAANNQLSCLNVSTDSQLIRLDIGNNKLRRVEFQGAASLKHLLINGNQLTELDVSSCQKLATLHCYGNQISQLKLPQNTLLNDFQANSIALTHIDQLAARTVILSGNRLEAFSIARPEQVLSIDFSYNRLAQIELNACTSLQRLIVNNNKLCALTLATPCLEVLCCANNLLTEIDIRKCLKLKVLNARCNCLQTIDLFCLVVLGELDLGENQLETCDISSNVLLQRCDLQRNKINNFVAVKHPELLYLNVAFNQLCSMTLRGAQQLIQLELQNNQLKTLDITDCVSIGVLYLQNNQLDNLQFCFRCPLQIARFACNRVRKLDIQHNNSIRRFEASAGLLVELRVADCAKLEYINVTNNQLESLFVGACDQLATIIAANNNIKCLTLAKCKALRTVTLSRNRLVQFRNYVLPSLSFLDLSFNQLTSIDLAMLPQLSVATAANNALVDCVLARNSSFKKLDLSKNKLTSLIVDDSVQICELNLSDNAFENVPTAAAFTMSLLRNRITDVRLKDAQHPRMLYINATSVALDKCEIEQLNTDAQTIVARGCERLCLVSCPRQSAVDIDQDTVLVVRR